MPKFMINYNMKNGSKYYDSITYKSKKQLENDIKAGFEILAFMLVSSEVEGLSNDTIIQVDEILDVEVIEL
jgi:hypothetical protein